jgi:hypothetical protein
MPTANVPPMASVPPLRLRNEEQSAVGVKLTLPVTLILPAVWFNVPVAAFDWLTLMVEK